MTREEAIKGLTSLVEVRKKYCDMQTMKDEIECLDMAIKALEQEPCEDAISRQAVMDGINEYFHDEYYQRTSIQDCRHCLIEDVIKDMPPVTPQQTKWIPVSERLPEHSYTKRFWLTVKLDDGKDAITTLIGTWGAWGDNNSSKSCDAFDCWKDVMINGGIYRFSQPIPKEQVLAWMPLPEPYDVESEDKE